MNRGLVALAMLLGSALASPGAGERLPLRRFTQASGLADDFVCVVRQDSRGIVWFGTGGGISRFDGSEFRNYGPAEGVPEGPVCDLLETRAGELVFATQGGLCRLSSPPATPGGAPKEDRRRFECATPDERPASSDVRTLHEDRLGRLWAGTAAGLYRVERRAERWRFERLPLADSPDPWAEAGLREIVEEPGGGLWLATSLGIVRVAESGRVDRFRVSGFGRDERIFALHFDSSGRLWIGHVDDGLFVWKPPLEYAAPIGWSLAGVAVEAEKGALHLPERAGDAIRIGRRAGLAEERVRTGILEDPDGAIWVGTVRGLARIHAGRLRLYGRDHGLPDEGTRPSLIDRAGNLWLGSPSGGAARLHRGGFTTFDAADGLRGHQIRSIFEGRDGALYVLSTAERDFVQRFDGERFEAVAPTLPGGAEYTGWWFGRVGLEDRGGEWWLPTGVAGLLRFPAVRSFAELAQVRPRAHYRSSSGLPDSVQVLYEDRRGDLWIGAFTPPYLSVRRRSTQRFEAFGAEHGLPADAPIAFAEDATGTLWIGFGDGTLGPFREGRLAPVDRSRLPPVSAVNDLRFDRDGRLWVATRGGGVARFDAPLDPTATARMYDVADGLPSNDVNCLTEDELGRIYAGTARGVARLVPASGEIRRFTTADGLPNNLVRAAFRDRRGELWFGTFQGLARLRLGSERPAPAPSVLLTAVEAAGAPQPLGETGAARLEPLELAAGADRLRVGFAAPSADLDEEPIYRYRLEGFESDWSAPTRDRAVTYAGLGPGRYRFAVAAASPGGEWGAPATFELEIPPPLWRRWWALAGYGAILFAAVWFVHGQRVARLVAVERVRARIAADLHDDLGASLSRIAVLSEVARRQTADDGRELPELVEIADTARQITDEAGDIVWAIDPRQDDLASLLLRLRPLAGDLLSERGIALEWSVPPPSDAASIHLAPDQRRHLLLILKEALHNAARHSGARRVAVRVDAGRDALRAEVSDDGRGFDSAHPVPAPGAVGGRGLPSLKARAREVGGTLVFESAPGKGTTVKLEMPR